MAGRNGVAGRNAIADEWHPSWRQSAVWNVAMVALFAAGVVVYGMFVVVANGPGPYSGGLVELLAALALFVALAVAHEAIHGAVMLWTGARPSFGAMLMAGIPAFYTTAPGHLFSRRQYLIVGLTPAVVVSTAGALLCLTPLGPLALFPFALHLAGCAGDLAIAREVLCRPPDVLCEDLRDGVRFVARGSGLADPSDRGVRG